MFLPLFAISEVGILKRGAWKSVELSSFNIPTLKCDDLNKTAIV